MKNQYPCIIVDDDPDAAEYLSEYIDCIPEITLKQIFNNPLEFVQQIHLLEKGTILFLDIDMPGMSGIDLAEILQHKPCSIIFTTAHSEFAVKSYELNAENYLLKPINEKKFVLAMNKLLHSTANQTPAAPPADDFFFLKSGDNAQKVRVFHKDILFVQAAENYIFVVTEHDKYMSYMTLKKMADILSHSPIGFYRVHKSYLINGDKVHRKVGNTAYIGSHEISMSPIFRDEFVAYMDSKTAQ